MAGDENEQQLQRSIQDIFEAEEEDDDMWEPASETSVTMTGDEDEDDFEADDSTGELNDCSAVYRSDLCRCDWRHGWRHRDCD